MREIKNLLKHKIFNKISALGFIVLILWLGIPFLASVICVVVYGAEYHYATGSYDPSPTGYAVIWTGEARTITGILLNLAWLPFAIQFCPFKWFLRG